MLKISGHSNFIIQIKQNNNNYYIEKSANKNEFERLKIQIKKQQKYKRYIKFFRLYRNSKNSFPTFE